jgi:hypothetical protein
MSEQRPLHRLFGLCWNDFCEGSALSVDPEKDLSVKQQFLDLLLSRQGPGPLPQPLPDGFDDLGDYNVLTFKSHREALDGFALCELISHYVNIRKQCSPSLKDLLPESAFRLYAVCVRFPHNLDQWVALTRIRAGVYEVPLVTQRIRLIVVQELPREQQNAFLLLFSTRQEQVQYAREHYRPRSSEMTTLFYDLFKTYSEDPEMSEALKEYARTRLKELLAETPLEQRLEGLSPEQRLEGLSPEQRLEGLSPEQRLEGLSPEQLRTLAEAAQRRSQANGPSVKPE